MLELPSCLLLDEVQDDLDAINNGHEPKEVEDMYDISPILPKNYDMNFDL